MTEEGAEPLTEEGAATMTEEGAATMTEVSGRAAGPLGPGRARGSPLPAQARWPAARGRCVGVRPDGAEAMRIFPARDHSVASPRTEYLWSEQEDEELEHALAPVPPPRPRPRLSRAVPSLTLRPRRWTLAGLRRKVAPPPATTRFRYKAVGCRLGGVVLSFLPWVHSACPSPPTLGMEVLCQRRNKLCRQIQKEEKEKQRLHNQLRRLTEKLALVNENLACKIASYKELDRTITESEAAFFKILESSQALLSVVKREAGNLSKVMASEQEIIDEKDSS
ncbi:PREDICTED: Sjoegren syndrome nuclear autoantigen 1 [Ceratotherium simum simum]|uniref:Sjoegren syndrome nuclear autoantigen 1 n=1 Tax=Ceratotherium simum simum TaxID=73337 RepID=A0ABM1CD46_CERSS|nr:PREDICTED: Sjoegren syndrome nuclear autoantigen 1 [Ceratotherium simum simum]